MKFPRQNLKGVQLVRTPQAQHGGAGFRQRFPCSHDGLIPIGGGKDRQGGVGGQNGACPGHVGGNVDVPVSRGGRVSKGEIPLDFDRVVKGARIGGGGINFPSLQGQGPGAERTGNEAYLARFQIGAANTAGLQAQGALFQYGSARKSVVFPKTEDACPLTNQGSRANQRALELVAGGGCEGEVIALQIDRGRGRCRDGGEGHQRLVTPQTQRGSAPKNHHGGIRQPLASGCFQNSRVEVDVSQVGLGSGHRQFTCPVLFHPPCSGQGSGKGGILINGQGVAQAGGEASCPRGDFPEGDGPQGRMGGCSDIQGSASSSAQIAA